MTTATVVMAWWALPVGAGAVLVSSDATATDIPVTLVAGWPALRDT